MRQRFRFGPRERQWLIAASLSFRRTAGPRHPQYVIDWPPNSLIPPYSLLLRPTVAVGENELVFAASSEAARACSGRSVRRGNRRKHLFPSCEGFRPR